jgi:hypothetical protein
VDNHILRLRQKLEKDPAKPQLLYGAPTPKTPREQDANAWTPRNSREIASGNLAPAPSAASAEQDDCGIAPALAEEGDRRAAVLSFVHGRNEHSPRNWFGAGAHNWNVPRKSIPATFTREGVPPCRRR